MSNTSIVDNDVTSGPLHFSNYLANFTTAAFSELNQSFATKDNVDENGYLIGRYTIVQVSNGLLSVLIK